MASLTLQSMKLLFCRGLDRERSIFSAPRQHMSVVEGRHGKVTVNLSKKIRSVISEPRHTAGPPL